MTSDDYSTTSFAASASTEFPLSNSIAGPPISYRWLDLRTNLCFLQGRVRVEMEEELVTCKSNIQWVLEGVLEVSINTRSGR